MASVAGPIITGLGIHNLVGTSHRGMGHILMFHRVIPDSNLSRVHNHNSLEVSPRHLERVVTYFKKNNYDFRSIDFLGEIGRSAVDKKFVVFTFDDGYLDNLVYAYPILKKHEVPFTIYVTTNFIKRKAVMWWYLLEKIILENNNLDFDIRGLPKTIGCKSNHEKEKAFNTLRKYFVENLSPRNSEKVYRSVFKPYLSDFLKFTDEHALTWDQVRTLAQDPLVTIGAHTTNHFPLKQMTEAELSAEVIESKVVLEKEIGHEVKHFAYPFGKRCEADTREYDFVERAGFSSGVTTNIDNIDSQHLASMFSLPRINITPYTDENVLRMHSSGFISYLKHKI